MSDAMDGSFAETVAVPDSGEIRAGGVDARVFRRGAGAERVAQHELLLDHSRQAAHALLDAVRLGIAER